MQSKSKILVVEDNASVRDALSDYLKAQGFAVVTAVGQSDALAVLRTKSPDLAVLDIVLSDGDGLSLFQEMRRFTQTPVIFLSGRSEDTERIIGLEIGADDYVTKPFNPRELTARIKAVLRRSQSPAHSPEAVLAGNCLYFGGCVFNSLTHELVNARGETVLLSKGERKLLTVLLRHPHQVLSRDQLLDITQGKRAEAFDRSVDNLVSRLRKKLEADPRSPKLIKTYWGGGYALSADVVSHPPEN